MINLPSTTSSSLQDIVKLSDLLSNKKDISKFLESLKEQEKAIKLETSKLSEERAKVEKLRGIKSAMDDLDAYKKESKAKADRIVLKAKDDAAIILADAVEEESQAKKTLSSVQQQQIDLKDSQAQTDTILSITSKDMEVVNSLKAKLKKLTDQANERIKKVTSLLEELKNV